MQVVTREISFLHCNQNHQKSPQQPRTAPISQVHVECSLFWHIRSTKKRQQKWRKSDVEWGLSCDDYLTDYHISIQIDSLMNLFQYHLACFHRNHDPEDKKPSDRDSLPPQLQASTKFLLLCSSSSSIYYSKAWIRSYRCSQMPLNMLTSSPAKKKSVPLHWNKPHSPRDSEIHQSMRTLLVATG